MTVDELLSELGVTLDPAKASVVKAWNDKFSALESGAEAKLEAANQSLADAQALQRVIDENIRTSGLTETNIAQLEANNAALQSALASRDAAIDSIKKQGFTGLEIPSFPEVSKPAVIDPVKELTDRIMSGFNMMGQTMNEVNRYQRVFGQPLPEDPATLADRAAKSHLSVRDYMEQTYKVSAKEREKSAAAALKEKEDYATQKIEEWKAAHPVTTGHPELGPGVPSNYPNIPKPSDATGVREMSGKSPLEKIRMARDRVVKEVQAKMAAA